MIDMNCFQKEPKLNVKVFFLLHILFNLPIEQIVHKIEYYQITFN